MQAGWGRAVLGACAGHVGYTEEGRCKSQGCRPHESDHASVGQAGKGEAKGRAGRQEQLLDVLCGLFRVTPPIQSATPASL